MKEEPMQLTGKIIKKLPGGKYECEVQNNHKIIVTPSGKMRKFNINISIGDWVDIEVSPYDLKNGRLVWRHRDTPPERQS